MERSVCFKLVGASANFKFSLTEDLPNNRRPDSYFAKGDKFKYFDYRTTFKGYKQYRERLNQLWEAKEDAILKCSPNNGIAFEEIVLGYSVYQISEDKWTMRLFLASDQYFE